MAHGTGPISGFKIGPKIAPKRVLELGQFWASKLAQKFAPKWVLELGQLWASKWAQKLLQNGSLN
jgi:hypothetical protein